MSEKPNTYSKAGVDIKREGQAIDSITSWVTKSFKFREGKLGSVISDIGSFANLIDLGDKALALCMDGVGSKLLVAQKLEKYDTIGIDLVAMNVNDVICCGAEPVCMVDYLAMEKMDYEQAKEIAAGIYVGAEQAQIAVIGGETATLPEMICGIGDRGFDLAAAVIGVADKDKIITGEDIKPGDKVIGLQSSGIHSNGLTLARKALPKSMWLNLLTPTRIYVKEVLELMKDYELKGMANITGGGLLNLKRLCSHGFRLDNMPTPPVVFNHIRKEADVSVKEMYKTFNMGMGFSIIAGPETCEKIIEARGEEFQAQIVGEVVEEEGVKLILDGQEHIID